MAELFTIPDEFNEPQGRWNGTFGQNPWTSTAFYENVHPDTYDDFLLTQRHIDVRSFRYVSDLIPVPQYPDLDTVPQYPNLDTVPQTDLELKPGSTISENWRATGTGIQQTFPGYWDLTTNYTTGNGVEYKGKYWRANTNNQGERPGTSSAWSQVFFVGKLDDRGGWYGLRSLANGSNIDATFTSFIKEELDISGMDSLSIILPDHKAVDLSTSTVTLYSGPEQAPSAEVAWVSYLSGSELRIPLSAFTATNFSLAKVSGIRIRVRDTSPPASGTKITLMAIRAVKNNWVPSALDFETRWGTIQPPVTLNGNLYAGTVARNFEFVRGNGSRFDPYPSDGAYTLFFYGGGEVNRDAIHPLVNRIGLILRENKTGGEPGAIFGKSAAGGTAVNMLANHLYAVHFTPTSSGTTTAVYWRIDGGGPGTGTATFRAAIYSNEGGHPNNLLAVSHPVQVTDTASATDVKFTLTTPVSLTASTQYWIAIEGDAEADSCRLFSDTLANKSRRVPGPFMNPWNTGNHVVGNNDFTAYIRMSTLSGSAIYTWLKWNNTGVWFEARRRDMTNGAVTETPLYSEQINSTGLDSTQLYAWTVSLVGTSLNSRLNVVNQNREIDHTTWILTTNNSNNWVFRNGRVGFIADLIDRDSRIDALVSAPVGYALLRTKIYESRDPIDGARLQAVYSPDGNLFDELIGADAFRDHSKTVSGKGSIRTLAGLETNSFIVDDWHETYLDIHIWTPSTVTPLNQPVIYLNIGSFKYPFDMPTLKGAQWNHLYFEFSIFKDLITGLPYTLSILPGLNPDKPLGFFWVDAVTIGRRKVAWAIRANSTAPFRRIRNMINRSDGSIHFNPDERGRELQLEVQALTPDAWINEFTIFPRYAELGLPVYDKGFETR